ncbi:hypothetical protein [Nocardia sp. NPDC052566]|uniref:hypothetical protein n=1 Tax=Nocardia sp. NPDC052566 TaxID=3364330 RepID=UPI0037CBD6D1
MIDHPDMPPAAPYVAEQRTGSSQPPIEEPGSGLTGPLTFTVTDGIVSDFVHNQAFPFTEARGLIERSPIDPPGPNAHDSEGESSSSEPAR